MKSSFLISLKEKFVSKSKKPWACFETGGISENGLGVAMSWNKSFIDSLHAKGIQGINDQETVQMFFLFLSSRIADNLQPENAVNPQATPNLTNEANTFIG